MVPPAGPDFAIGDSYEDTNGLTTLTFERSNSYWYYYPANSFKPLGVAFEGRWLAAVYTGGTLYNHRSWWGIFRAPAASGEWAISMGDWHNWYSRDHPESMTWTWSWRFKRPVSELSFKVRPQGDFELTCYDQAGVVTETRLIPGLISDDGKFRTPYDQFTIYPLHHVKMQGGGIARCQVVSRGGVLDDFSFRLEPLSKVTLSCSPAAVTRGDPVTCTASSAESNWEVTGWKFVSSDGQEEVEPLDPAQESSPRWHGPMVRSGTVHVMATVGGEAQTASTQVAVGDRDWAGRGPTYTFERIENGADSRLELPIEVTWSDDLGSANWFQSETPQSTIPDYTTEVRSGPNDGLDYFSDETTLRVFGYYVLNQAAMTRGSPFYAAQQRGGGSGATQLGGMNWCPARVVTETLPGLVEGHEQMHGSAYERALAREAGAALTRLERTTASDVGVLYDEYDRVWTQVHGTAHAESKGIHAQAGGLVSPTSGGRPCALRNQFGDLLQAEP